MLEARAGGDTCIVRQGSFCAVGSSRSKHGWSGEGNCTAPKQRRTGAIADRNWWDQSVQTTSL